MTDFFVIVPTQYIQNPPHLFLLSVDRGFIFLSVCTIIVSHKEPMPQSTTKKNRSTFRGPSTQCHSRLLSVDFLTHFPLSQDFARTFINSHILLIFFSISSSYHIPNLANKHPSNIFPQWQRRSSASCSESRTAYKNNPTAAVNAVLSVTQNTARFVRKLVLWR